MTHVQLTGNVRRRHHDGVRFLVRIGLRVEVAAIQPELVDTIFHDWDRTAFQVLS